MGLLDQVIGAVSGSGGQPGGGSPLLALVMQLINNPQLGGLAGLVQSFQNGGLGEIVNSWVSTGRNLPISAEQVHGVLGGEQIANIASQLGISSDQASGQIAEILPQFIDKMTPNGSLPEGNELMAQDLELFKGKLFG
jgi:uncharacterized protein YidB (DUF937 family)